MSEEKLTPEVKDAVEKLEKFLEAFHEYPDWNAIGWDNIDAIETLVEYVKTTMK